MEEKKLPRQSFIDLKVWQSARLLKNEIYLLIKDFPQEEKYRLTDQIIRSVRSIATNISEGHGRYTYKDQIHFCIQSRGSLNETLNHLIDAYDCKIIDEETLKIFKEKIDSVGRLLNGYITYLKSQIK